MDEEILDNLEPQKEPKEETTTIKRNILGLSVLVVASIVIAFYYLGQNANRNLVGAPPVRDFVENRPTIPDNLSEQFREGRALFLEQCAACHNIGMEADMTGPALRGVTQRRDQEWLLNYIRNSMQMVEDKDSTAVALFEQWDESIMVAFPNLSDEDIRSILVFIENR
ncbi:MAG: cytochrome c [Aureispira sp.]|nr:cytochrome c [Aureispira sp.]